MISNGIMIKIKDTSPPGHIRTRGAHALDLQEDGLTSAQILAAGGDHGHFFAINSQGECVAGVGILVHTGGVRQGVIEAHGVLQPVPRL